MHGFDLGLSSRAATSFSAGANATFLHFFELKQIETELLQIETALPQIDRIVANRDRASIAQWRALMVTNGITNSENNFPHCQKLILLQIETEPSNQHQLSHLI